MANDTATNPMILRGTGTFTYTAFPSTTGNKLLIKRIIWRNQQIDGDDLVLTLDGVSVTRKGIAGSDSIVIDADLDITTFVIATLDGSDGADTGSTLEVWLR